MLTGFTLALDKPIFFFTLTLFKKKIMHKIIIIFVICFMGITGVKAQDNAVPLADTMTIYRKKIDELDKKIIQLLGERIEAAKAIGAYKMAHNVAVVQPDRFKKVLQQAISEGQKVGLSAAFIRKLYAAVHAESVRQEEGLKRAH